MPKVKGEPVGAIHELPLHELPSDSGGHESPLPWQAFAIAGDRNNPYTWKLPHHDRSIHRAIKGKIGMEHTVDWSLMPAAVALLSRAGLDGRRVEATENEIIDAARHLAVHFKKAGKPLPDALAVLC